MFFSLQEKQKIKRQLAGLLSQNEEVTRVVVFGSFIRSDDPHDIDVAVFQKSREPYLPLALKYRRLTREISRSLPVDIFPLKTGLEIDKPAILADIEAGETIYEK